MKKVSIFVLHLNYGGIEKCAVSLANVLCEKYDVEIVSTYRINKEPQFVIDPRVSIKYLIEDENPNREEWLSLFKRLRFFKCFKEGLKSIRVLKNKYAKNAVAMRDCDSDVIISTRVYLNELLGKYGSKKAYKIGWEHNHHRRKVSNVNKLVASTINLDKVVFVSKELTNWYTREYKVRRIPVTAVHIPNFLDEMPKEVSKLNTNNFISVGRLSKEKGFLDLVKVFKIMHDFNPDIHLDIIGDGNQKEKIINLIKEYKLDKVITLHGFKNKDDINKMYQKSSIYLNTSFTESFGLALLEGMSYGLPCISFTSAEGANELIIEGYNGYLVNNRGTDEMARVALELLKDQEKLSIMSKNALEVAKKYDKEIIKEEWFNLIKNK